MYVYIYIYVQWILPDSSCRYGARKPTASNSFVGDLTEPPPSRHSLTPILLMVISSRRRR